MPRAVELIAEQAAVLSAGPGPVRVLGGFGTGKTTALQARANNLASGSGRRRVLVLSRSRTAAQRFHGDAAPGVEVSTFADYALAILSSQRGPVRLVERPEQQAIVEGLLTIEGRDEWPLLHGQLHHVAFAEEVAATVLRYQSVCVDPNTLLARAAALGAHKLWAELVEFVARYLDALDERRAVDTAGALDQAASLLLDNAEAAVTSKRYTAIIVDDYEVATTATHRLLTALAGAGETLTVAGNLDAAIQGWHGASAEHLATMKVAADLQLTHPLRSAGNPWLVTGDRVDEPAAIAETLETARADGFSWSEMAVLARGELDARSLASRLPRGFTVATIDAAGGLEWPLVVVAGCREGQFPAPFRTAQWFDPFLMHSAALPSDAEREQLWLAEEARRYQLATSRATRRLVLIAPPPPSRFVAS